MDAIKIVAGLIFAIFVGLLIMALLLPQLFGVENAAGCNSILKSILSQIADVFGSTGGSALC